MNDLEITALIKDLSRPHPGGGLVIERAAILAAGTDSPQIIDWIISHAGQPEIPETRQLGLHGSRTNASGNSPLAKPTRFVLPAGTLS